MKFNSAKLTDLMQENNETAYRLAKNIGVSQTTIRNWQSGSNVPQLAKLAALASHYNVAKKEFLI